MLWLACTCTCGRTDMWTDGRICGRTDGHTDARTCNDIVLSHDRKRIFVKKIFPRVEKILQVPVLGIFSEISLSPQKVSQR
jgi:hypothetical protein